MENRATIFLDRDGVINKERRGYVRNWSEFEMLPGVIDALRGLVRRGYQLVIVTNQSCVNRGYCSAKDVEDIHRKLIAQLEMLGITLRGIIYCPHRPSDKCRCRKPEIGLFLDATSSFSIDLAKSWVIGDSDSDVEAAKRLGCRYVKVRKNGNLAHSIGLDSGRCLITSVK